MVFGIGWLESQLRLSALLITDAGTGAEGLAQHGADGESLPLAAGGVAVTLDVVDDGLGVRSEIRGQIVEVVDDLAYVEAGATEQNSILSAHISVTLRRMLFLSS